MNATSKEDTMQPGRCPSCDARLPDLYPVLRAQLHALARERNQATDAAAQLRASSDAAAQQDAQRAQRLVQAKDNAEARADQAERAAAATRAELDALRRSIGDLLGSYSAGAAQLYDQAQRLARVGTCAGCGFIGERDLVGGCLNCRLEPAPQDKP